MKTAIYAGSFSILTFGHLDIMKKAVKMFGNLTVLVSNNAHKKYTQSHGARAYTVSKSAREAGLMVQVIPWTGLVVDWNIMCPRERILIRGIRNTTDMIEEMQLADINKEIGGLETIFIPCSNELRNVSSSLVRELMSHKKDVSKYVPPYALSQLGGDK